MMAVHGKELLNSINMNIKSNVNSKKEGLAHGYRGYKKSLKIRKSITNRILMIIKTSNRIRINKNFLSNKIRTKYQKIIRVNIQIYKK